MIRLEQVGFRYATRTEPTLENINLLIHSGERVLIAGRTGCGKSTLLKVINGLIPACSKGFFSGSAMIDGLDTCRCTPEEMGMVVGTVYQSPDDQLFAMTVKDEVGFVLENQGISAALIEVRVAEALRQVGLQGLEKRSIHALSGGQRQRLALASVLVSRPKVLILDEPLSQLNPRAVSDFLQLLLELNQEFGITLIVVEHRIHELHTFFPRLVLLSRGRLVYDGLIQMAWETIGGNVRYGLREPQAVRLSRQLGICPLEADGVRLAGRIKQEYRLKTDVPEEKAAVRYQATVAKKAVVVNRVCFTYPGMKQPVLNDICLSLDQGEVVALMGNNGAGKSTLLNLLCGLIKPDRGEISIMGGTVKANSHRIGFLRQEPDLMLLRQSVLEEIAWGGGKEQARIEELLQQLGLADKAADYPLALSKGQRLRVVLAALLAKGPELLLLDEPTSGQDYRSMLDIRQLIDRYRQSGGTVLFCTHDVELAADIADRVLLFAAGQLIDDGSPHNVLVKKESIERGGLVFPPMLAISKALGMKAAITVKEVAAHVHTAVVGGN